MEVPKTRVTNPISDGIETWMLIWGAVGAAAALIILLALIIYLRWRSARAKKKTLEAERPAFVPGIEYGQKHMLRSSSSSTGSDESSSESVKSSTAKDGNHRALSPSLSLDANYILRTSPECVQPRPALTRWYTVDSPHCAIAHATLNTDSNKYRVSDDDEPTCLYGRLWFTLTYDEEENKLNVTLIKAKYLPGRGLTNSPRDPFVKIFLLPDEETYFCSKIRKRTLSPKFNETFSFPVPPDNISSRSLRFSVYDVDKRKIRHSLGHVIFPLSKANLTSNEIIWRDLDTTAQQLSSIGEIQISMGCNPALERIKTGIVKLHSLQGVNADDVIYVRVQLYHGNKLMKTKKTSPKPAAADKESDEIIIDETFHFAISGRYFDSCSFVFTVMVSVTKDDPAVKDEKHSRICIGPFMYARGEQLLHWQEMLTNTKNVVTKWHNLEPV